MNRQEFQDLIDAYGAAEAGWPEDRRGAALAFLDSDVWAPEMLTRARALDAALCSQAGPSPQFRASLARLAMQPRAARLSDLFRFWWRMAAPAVAASALLGMVVGTDLAGAAAEDGVVIDALAFSSLSGESLP